MEINEYLFKLIQIIKELEDVDFFMGDAQLNNTEFRLLREIVMDGDQGKGIISSELARRLGITRSAVSQTVSKLEKRNIVKRVASPTDRKIAYICLSEHAVSVFEKQCEQANEVMARVVKELGEKKLRNLITAYDEFAEVLTRISGKRRK